MNLFENQEPTKSYCLTVRIPKEFKAELEVKAAAEGLTLVSYVRSHLIELSSSQRAIIDSAVSANSTKKEKENTRAHKNGRLHCFIENL